MMAVGGSRSLEWDSEETGGGKPSRSWLRTKANSIEGGTSEVMLNVIAKRILDLPGA
jgi:alkylation response protein AidB-like acyl-CoA dehydrogenase